MIDAVFEYTKVAGVSKYLNKLYLRFECFFLSEQIKKNFIYT